MRQIEISLHLMDSIIKILIITNTNATMPKILKISIQLSAIIITIIRRV